MSLLLFLSQNAPAPAAPVVTVGTAPAPKGGSAISSAVELADLALSWSNMIGNADLSILDMDFATDRGLFTAIVLSLFTDRRAEVDDVPPSGNPLDRRGWWADQFADVDGDKIGSRLWLLDRSKRTHEAVLRAKECTLEALQWMLDDKVAAGVDPEIEMSNDGLLFAIGVLKPNGDRVSFRFARKWDHLQEDT